MNKKNIYIVLLLIFIILLLFIINRNKFTINPEIEYFANNNLEEEQRSSSKFSKSGYLLDSYNKLTTTSTTATNSSDQNQWTTDKTVLETTNAVLQKLLNNDNEYNTSLKNMISSVNQSQLKTLISTQSPLLVGPQGVQGPQGPAGTTLVASGRLINKSTSDPKNNSNLVVTRTDGTNPGSSFSYMDDLSPFASFQYWQLDINNNLVNKYDQSCLTMNPTQNKLYMDKCSNDNENQKWSWDNTNRLISTTASTDTKLKCIGLSKPEINIVKSNTPGCIGSQCLNNNPQQYLEIKDCDINNINENEIWSFI